MKTNLIFDFDDTLFLTTPILVEYMNQRWNINSNESDFIDSSRFKEVIQKYRKDFSITNEEIYLDYRENLALSSEWNKKITPMPFMIEVIKELREKFFLFIVTKRSNNSSHLVEGIVEKFISGCIKEIHFAVKHINGSQYIEIPKRDFILNLEGENSGFVDDSLSEIIGTNEIVPSFLFDHRNMFTEINGIKILKNWQEIGEKFL